VNVTDSVVLSELVDGTIMVVRAFSTQRKLIEMAREQLGHAKARVVGFVLNNVNVPSRGYAYYSYDYYKQSGYYAMESPEERRGAHKGPAPKRLLPRLFARKEKRTVPDGDAEATSRRAKT
jgi:Mrp family chromosome partitioning ATPase